MRQDKFQTKFTRRQSAISKGKSIISAGGKVEEDGAPGVACGIESHVSGCPFPPPALSTYLFPTFSQGDHKERDPSKGSNKFQIVFLFYVFRGKKSPKVEINSRKANAPHNSGNDLSTFSSGDHGRVWPAPWVRVRPLVSPALQAPSAVGN